MTLPAPPSHHYSPLRYPGGKQSVARVLAHLIDINDARGGTYIEPYAGGAGAALSLLLEEHVDRIIINDADSRVYALWKAALTQTSAFIKLIETVPLSIREWKRQRDIYQAGDRRSILSVGFATFYLNRCNRSGIIAGGGPIGGLKQRGRWKIDARFNRQGLSDRIRRIAEYRDRIEVTNLDAMALLTTRVAKMPKTARAFAYLDPPYFAKGQDLYMNHYKPSDHATVARFVKDGLTVPWVMSYDDVPEIHKLYRTFRTVPLSLDYSARERREGSEILILKPHLKFPTAWRRGIPLAAIARDRRRLKRGAHR